MSSRKSKAFHARPPSFSDTKQRKGNGAASPLTRLRVTWLLLPTFLFATLLAYQPAWRGGMLWDDASHITRSDLQSVDGLWRIWFKLDTTQQYYPALHSAFWVFHRLWGDDTLGYHLLNMVFHALSAFLFVVILRRLAIPGAFLAAMIFALHPVHVESVAWISEMKNTLSAVFYLGAALAYLHFYEKRKKDLYALALGLFVIALLCKTVSATLPAALLVVFWWKRGRLNWRHDALPLAPFVVLGAGAGLVTAWVERTIIGAQGAEYQFTFIERVLIAGRALCFYLGKLFWPADLVFIYPRWQVSAGVWWQFLYPLGAAILLGILWLVRKRSRAPLAAMLLFSGTLFPALGFINVYPFRFSFVADHFQYLASLSIIALFSAGAASLALRRRLPPAVAPATVIVLGIILGVLTWNQSRQYGNAETLYRTTLNRNPACWLAHVNLGILLMHSAADEAETHFKAALRLNPNAAEAHINLGMLMAHRDARESEAHLREALRLKPTSAEAQNNLGYVLQGAGRLEEAVAHLEEALRLNPEYADARYNLATALLRMGRTEEAVAQYREAIRVAGDSAEAHNDLGFALQRLGRFEEAAKYFGAALRLKEDYPEAHYNLANTWQELGHLREAEAEYQAALRYRPDFAEAHNNWGAALERMGRLNEAAIHYREALKIKPAYPAAQENLNRLQSSPRK